VFLEKETFKTVINSAPLVSIDLLVQNSEGKYLLGYRTNKPAQEYWFVPGGRILKNENFDDAFMRLCENELGVRFERSNAELIGPFEHFYDDYVFGDDVSTHYVVLGYKVILDVDIGNLPDKQHNSYRWFTKEEMLRDLSVHKHSRWYVE